MRRWYEFLASLKLTVILVLLIGVVLSAGTIYESLKGAEAARAVYYAPWFYALQGLFALNILCGLIERWPRNRWRIGFAITHLSMLLILLGALDDARLQAVEGRMPIWEGDSSNVVFQAERGGEADRAAVQGAARRLRDRHLSGHAAAGDVPQPRRRPRPGGEGASSRRSSR